MQKGFPTLLHGLYRHAVKVLGADETAERLAAAMNARSAELFPHCPIRSDLKMTRLKFWEFFYKSGGKLKRAITKPRLSMEQIKARVKFAEKWLRLLESGEKIYYCFLDEKWFYTTSRRRKFKILPQAIFESLKDAFFIPPKVRNRRHPCKVMYLGIVGPPTFNDAGETISDGKILLKRVSVKHTQPKKSYNQHFHPLYEINHKLRIEEWKLLFPPTITTVSVNSLLDAIAQNYNLPPSVLANLCFTYNSTKIVTKKGGKSKVFKEYGIKIHRSDGDIFSNRVVSYPHSNGQMELCQRPLSLKDLHLKVVVPAQSVTDRDVSCDSKFMSDSIDEIGSSIRSHYSFVPHNKPIYLFMDNAGGHGKVDVKEEYVKKLAEVYNIIVEWQVPHSPETNMLDLGVWMALQCHMEQIHKERVMRNDILACSVSEAYTKVDHMVLTRVYERWKLVLRLIIAGKGTNNLVESHRSLRANLVSLPTLPEADSDDDDVILDLIKKAEDEDNDLRIGGDNAGSDVN